MFYVATTRAADYLILSSGVVDPALPVGEWRELLAERFTTSDAVRQSSFRISLSPELAEQKREVERCLYQAVYRHPRLVAVRGEGTRPVPLPEVAGRLKLVPPDHPWVQSARFVGTCLGD